MTASGHQIGNQAPGHIESALKLRLLAGSSLFIHQLAQNGVFAHDTSRPQPDECIGLLRTALFHGSPEPAWDEAQYKRYVELVQKPWNLETRKCLVLAELFGAASDPSYPWAIDQFFAGLPKVGFNNNLGTPSPWWIEGFKADEYGRLPDGKPIPGAAITQTHPCSIAFPHIAGEWGKGWVPLWKSAHTGAALIYARCQALSCMGLSKDPLLRVPGFTFTTDGTYISFYAVFMVEGDRGVRYYQHEIASTKLIDSFEDWRKGKLYLKNFRQLAYTAAKGLRDEVGKWLRERGGVGNSSA